MAQHLAEKGRAFHLNFTPFLLLGEKKSNDELVFQVNVDGATPNAGW